MIDKKTKFILRVGYPNGPNIGTVAKYYSEAFFKISSPDGNDHLILTKEILKFPLNWKNVVEETNICVCGTEFIQDKTNINYCTNLLCSVIIQ
jgi:hypothetical protein